MHDPWIVRLWTSYWNLWDSSSLVWAYSPCWPFKAILSKHAHLSLKLMKNKQKNEPKNNRGVNPFAIPYINFKNEWRAKELVSEGKLSFRPCSSQPAVWAVSEDALPHHLLLSPLFIEIRKYPIWKTGFYSASKIVWDSSKCEGVYIK